MPKNKAYDITVQDIVSGEIIEFFGYEKSRMTHPFSTLLSDHNPWEEGGKIEYEAYLTLQNTLFQKVGKTPDNKCGFTIVIRGKRFGIQLWDNKVYVCGGLVLA